MTDVAAIVAKMTDAQKRAVLGATIRYSLGAFPGTEPMQVNAGGATVALCNKALIRDRDVQSLSGRRTRIYALTPLGLAVRAYLEGTNHV